MLKDIFDVMLERDAHGSKILVFGLSDGLEWLNLSGWFIEGVATVQLRSLLLYCGIFLSKLLFL